MTGDGRTDLRKLLRLVPALVMRDPLFRYAAIAAILALLFLIGQFAQDLVLQLRMKAISCPIVSLGCVSLMNSSPQRP